MNALEKDLVRLGGALGVAGYPARADTVVETAPEPASGAAARKERVLGILYRWRDNARKSGKEAAAGECGEIISFVEGE